MRASRSCRSPSPSLPPHLPAHLEPIRAALDELAALLLSVAQKDMEAATHTQQQQTPRRTKPVFRVIRGAK